MRAPLRLVSLSVRDFVDALMTAHWAASPVPLRALLACFGGPDPGAPDSLVVTPSKAAAHPEGVLSRRAPEDSLVELGGARLLFPGAFVATYKIAVAGYSAAARLGFAGGRLLLEDSGVVKSVLTVILDPRQIDVGTAYEVIEFPIED